MRMNNLFWPIVIIAGGVLMLLNAILPWHIPVGRILLAAVLIYVGVGMLTGNHHWLKWNAGDYQVEADSNSAEYSVVFSERHIDLTGANDLPPVIKLNAAFSSAEVRLPVDYNITIKASGAFCSINLPDNQNIVFGEGTYSCGVDDPAAPSLYIDANCAFGSLSFTMG